MTSLAKKLFTELAQLATVPKGAIHGMKRAWATLGTNRPETVGAHYVTFGPASKARLVFGERDSALTVGVSLAVGGSPARN